MGDKDISDEELVNYIPQFFWYKLFLPHYSSPKYSLIGGNKIVMKQFFDSLHIRQPKTLMMLLNKSLYTSEMEKVSFTRMKPELENNNCEKLFVKPTDGSGGRGIYVFHKNQNGEYKNQQNVSFNENFLTAIGKNNDYIIQSGIVQIPEFSEIYPYSVNTCRIITEQKNGLVKIICAMLRIGRGQKEVDNISLDGICTHINRQGKLGDFATSYKGERLFDHPDTHVIFSAKSIPRWDEIRKFTIESAEKLPYFTYLAWDIALTPCGPLAIEINSAPAVDIMEMTSSGLREAFGIEDPDYYWKNPGKRV
jgi:predicted nucleic acid-binding Zn finger protein